MTSMPASRSARAMIFAPRSWPSRPGLATTTRILRFEDASIGVRSYPAALRRSAVDQLRERGHQPVDADQAHVAAGLVAAGDRVEAILGRPRHGPAGDQLGRVLRGDGEQPPLV